MRYYRYVVCENHMEMDDYQTEDVKEVEKMVSWSINTNYNLRQWR